MSKSARARKRRVNYDANPPRCANCQHFKFVQWGMRDSLPYIVSQPRCKRNEFFAQESGVCDTWEGRDGSKLE